jgi:ribosomal protein S18 acetylase RimI-like enzyme
VVRFTTRAAETGDVDAIVELLPRLADYPLPSRREAHMFWSSDADLVRRWAAGEAPASFVRVGVESESVVAAAVVTMNTDYFSGEPNAHLEAIAIHSTADGHGLGRRLIEECELEARRLGARSMSLHVLGNNQRARAIYQKLGYDEEMIRAVRFLD